MLSVEYELDRKFDDIIHALEIFGGGILPHTAEAVDRAADSVVGIWSQVASGAFKHTTGLYIHGIERGKIYPFNGDKFHSAVINTLPHAKILEDGYGSFDMKKMLRTSHQVRISKKGKRYLIIPFRHGIGGMPKKVYAEAKELTISHRTGIHREPSIQGAKSFKQARLQLIQGHPRGKFAYRFRSDWGGKLKQGTVEGGTPKKYIGMVRFPREQWETTGTKYLTFRVMSEDSEGWIHPGIPPMKIAQRSLNASKFPVQRLIQQGFEEDKKEFVRMYL